MNAINTTTTTGGELANASASISSNVGSANGLSSVFIILVFIAIAVFVGSSVARIEWVHKRLKVVAKTLPYAAIGLASTVFVGMVAMPIYLLSRLDGETQAWVGIAIVGLVAAYGAFTLVGYVVDTYILVNVRAYRERLSDVARDSEAE